MPFTIICKNPECGREYESRYSHKLFCTLKCYRESPQFQAMLRENSKRIADRKLAASQNGDTTRKTINCLHCEKEVFTKPSRSSKRSQHRYCSQRCYREYMSGRFDRYIASPESLALPQNYDEFLTGDELHCLIEGCGWSGLQLSSHMNLAHGIRKDEFKEKAGFNVGTGVVTAAYSERLSQSKIAQGWTGDHMAHLRSLVKSRGSAPPDSKRNRLEGKEHRAKARALMEAEAPERELRCEGCNQMFITTAYIKKYCTVECRDAFYAKEFKNIYDARGYPLVCAVCNNPFNGTFQQQNRRDSGLIVVCSTTCRQRRAGRIARGTWEGE